MKKISKFLALVVSIVIMASCGGSSIVGRWKNENAEFEFFSDGTYTSDIDGYSGDYTAENGRLKLEGQWVQTQTITYKVKGNSLYLYDDDGNLQETLTRQ